MMTFSDTTLLDWWEINPDRILVQRKQDILKPGALLRGENEFLFAFRDKRDRGYSEFYPKLRDCLTNAIRSDKGLKVEPPKKEEKSNG